MAKDNPVYKTFGEWKSTSSSPQNNNSTTTSSNGTTSTKSNPVYKTYNQWQEEKSVETPKSNSTLTTQQNAIAKSGSGQKLYESGTTQKKGIINRVTDLLQRDITNKKVSKFEAKYGNKTNEDTFLGTFKSNYGLGRITQNASIAWNDYLNDPTEENRLKAERLSSLAETYQVRNAKSLDDKKANGEKYGKIGKAIANDYAQYLPQLGGQIGTSALLAAPGAIKGAIQGASVASPLLADDVTGFGVADDIAIPIAAIIGGVKGSTTGITIGSGVYSYNTMRGMAFKNLIDMGASEGLAKDAAEDEAIVSSLIEMGDTFTDMKMFASVKGLLAGTAVGKIEKILAESPALIKWIGNASQEYGEEFVQEVISAANEARVEDGLGSGGVTELMSYITQVLNVDNLSRFHEAGVGGFTIGMIGGGIGNAYQHTMKNLNLKAIEHNPGILDNPEYTIDILEGIRGTASKYRFGETRQELFETIDKAIEKKKSATPKANENGINFNADIEEEEELTPAQKGAITRRERKAARDAFAEWVANNEGRKATPISRFQNGELASSYSEKFVEAFNEEVEKYNKDFEYGETTPEEENAIDYNTEKSDREKAKEDFDNLVSIFKENNRNDTISPMEKDDVHSDAYVKAYNEYAEAYNKTATREEADESSKILKIIEEAKQRITDAGLDARSIIVHEDGTVTYAAIAEDGTTPTETSTVDEYISKFGGNINGENNNLHGRRRNVAFVYDRLRFPGRRKDNSVLRREGQNQQSKTEKAKEVIYSDFAKSLDLDETVPENLTKDSLYTTIKNAVESKINEIFGSFKFQDIKRDSVSKRRQVVEEAFSAIGLSKEEINKIYETLLKANDSAKIKDIQFVLAALGKEGIMTHLNDAERLNVYKEFIAPIMFENAITENGAENLAVAIQSALGESEKISLEIADKVLANVANTLIENNVFTEEQLASITDAYEYTNMLPEEVATEEKYVKPGKEYAEKELKESGTKKPNKILDILNPKLTGFKKEKFDTIQYGDEYFVKTDDMFYRGGNKKVDIYQVGTADNYVLVDKETKKVLGKTDQWGHALTVAEQKGQYFYEARVVLGEGDVLTYGRNGLNLDLEATFANKDNLVMRIASAASKDLDILLSKYGTAAATAKMFEAKLFSGSLAEKNVNTTMENLHTLLHYGVTASNGDHYVFAGQTASGIKKGIFIMMREEEYNQVKERMASNLSDEEIGDMNISKYLSNRGTYFTPSNADLDCTVNDCVVVSDLFVNMHNVIREFMHTDTKMDRERLTQLVGAEEAERILKTAKIGFMTTIVGDMLTDVVDGTGYINLPEGCQLRADVGGIKGCLVGMDWVKFYNTIIPEGTTDTLVFDDEGKVTAGFRHLDGKGVEILDKWGTWQDITGKKALLFDSTVKFADKFKSSQEFYSKVGKENLRSVPKENVYGANPDAGMVEGFKRMGLGQLLRNQYGFTDADLAKIVSENVTDVIANIQKDYKLSAKVLGVDLDRKGFINTTSKDAKLLNLLGEKFFDTNFGRTILMNKLQQIVDDAKAGKLYFSKSKQNYQWIAPDMIGLMSNINAISFQRNEHAIMNGQDVRIGMTREELEKKYGEGTDVKFTFKNSYTGLKRGEILNSNLESNGEKGVNTLVGRYPSMQSSDTQVRKNISNEYYDELINEYGLDKDFTLLSVTDPLMYYLDSDFDGDTAINIQGSLAEIVDRIQKSMIKKAQEKQKKDGKLHAEYSFTEFVHGKADKYNVAEAKEEIANGVSTRRILSDDAENSNKLILAIRNSLLAEAIGKFDRTLDKLAAISDKEIWNAIKAEPEKYGFTKEEIKKLRSKASKQEAIDNFRHLLQARFAVAYKFNVDYAKTGYYPSEFKSVVDKSMEMIDGIAMANGYSVDFNEGIVPNFYENGKPSKANQFEEEYHKKRNSEVVSVHGVHFDNREFNIRFLSKNQFLKAIPVTEGEYRGSIKIQTTKGEDLGVISGKEGIAAELFNNPDNFQINVKSFGKGENPYLKITIKDKSKKRNNIAYDGENVLSRLSSILPKTRLFNGHAIEFENWYNNLYEENVDRPAQDLKFSDIQGLSFIDPINYLELLNIKLTTEQKVKYGFVTKNGKPWRRSVYLHELIGKLYNNIVSKQNIGGYGNQINSRDIKRKALNAVTDYLGLTPIQAYSFWVTMLGQDENRSNWKMLLNMDESKIIEDYEGDTTSQLADLALDLMNNHKVTLEAKTEIENLINSYTKQIDQINEDINSFMGSISGSIIDENIREITDAFISRIKDLASQIKSAVPNGTANEIIDEIRSYINEYMEETVKDNGYIEHFGNTDYFTKLENNLLKGLVEIEKVTKVINSSMESLRKDFDLWTNFENAEYNKANYYNYRTSDVTGLEGKTISDIEDAFDDAFALIEEERNAYIKGQKNENVTAEEMPFEAPINETEEIAEESDDFALRRQAENIAETYYKAWNNGRGLNKSDKGLLKENAKSFANVVVQSMLNNGFVSRKTAGLRTEPSLDTYFRTVEKIAKLYGYQLDWSSKRQIGDETRIDVIKPVASTEADIVTEESTQADKNTRSESTLEFLTRRAKENNISNQVHNEINKNADVNLTNAVKAFESSHISKSDSRVKNVLSSIRELKNGMHNLHKVETALNGLKGETLKETHPLVMNHNMMNELHSAIQYRNKYIKTQNKSDYNAYCKAVANFSRMFETQVKKIDSAMYSNQKIAEKMPVVAKSMQGLEKLTRKLRTRQISAEVMFAGYDGFTGEGEGYKLKDKVSFANRARVELQAKGLMMLRQFTEDKRFKDIASGKSKTGIYMGDHNITVDEALKMDLIYDMMSDYKNKQKFGYYIERATGQQLISSDEDYDSIRDNIKEYINRPENKFIKDFQTACKDVYYYMEHDSTVGKETRTLETVFRALNGINLESYSHGKYTNTYFVDEKGKPINDKHKSASILNFRSSKEFDFIRDDVEEEFGNTEKYVKLNGLSHDIVDFIEGASKYIAYGELYNELAIRNSASNGELALGNIVSQYNAGEREANWLEQYITDIGSYKQRTKNDWDRAMNAIMSLEQGAYVTANVSTIPKQFSNHWTALDKLDLDSLVKARLAWMTKTKIKDFRENPLLYARKQNSHPDFEKIETDSVIDLVQNSKTMQSLRGLLQKADYKEEYQHYLACLFQAKKENRGASTEEIVEKADEMFANVVLHNSPMFYKEMKSEYARTDNSALKVLGMFRTVIDQMENNEYLARQEMLASRGRYNHSEKTKAYKKVRAGNAMSALSIAIIGTAVNFLLKPHQYEKDDEEGEPELDYGSLVSEIISNIIKARTGQKWIVGDIENLGIDLAGNITGIDTGEFYAPTVSPLEDILKVSDYLQKVTTNPSLTNWKNLVNSITTVAGVSTNNAYKVANAVLIRYMDAIGENEDRYSDILKLIDSEKPSLSKSMAENAELMLKNELKGNLDKSNRAYSYLKQSDGNYENSIQNKLKSMYLDNKLNEDQLYYLVDKYLYSDKDSIRKSELVNDLVTSWYIRKETGIDYNDLDDEFLKGNIDRDTFIQYQMVNGKDEDTAMVNADRIEFLAEHPSIEKVTDGFVDIYNSVYVNFGISGEDGWAFYDAYEHDLPADKDEWGKSITNSKMYKVIEWLANNTTLTDEQKTALFKTKYSEKNLKYVPWKH